VKAPIAMLAGGLLFALAATANSGGYRYGVSDQAFYVPAIAMTLDSSLFPRDAEVIAPQVRMWPGRHLFAAASRALSLDLPALFALTYLLTLAILYAAGIHLGRALGLSWWAIAALLCLFTLRHQIARTGANSLEAYMHPRMLAFACGLAGVAWLLRGRLALAWAAAVVTAVVHPTTAIWFGALAAVATMVAPGPASLRARMTGALAATGVAIVVMLVVMRPDFGVMDAAWREAMQEKTYLFAAEWPASAWFLNLAYAVAIAMIFRRRRRLGRAVPAETAMVLGLFALVAGFFVSAALTAAGITAVIQLQVSRIFWLLDAVTAAYLAWWLVDDVAARRPGRLHVVVAATLALVSAGRGYYLLRVQADRPLARVGLPPGGWTDAMMWLRSRPEQWHVFADPAHGWLYGSSVRVAAFKDTWLELSKDSAMALYDRQAALRAAERRAAIPEPWVTDAAVQVLDAKYGLDVFVLDSMFVLDRPVLYRNSDFVFYDLR
jgi:hypothetical protein